MLSVAPIDNPVSGQAPFVGEINDIDLRDRVDDDVFGIICDSWLRYPVLVFRDQNLSAGEQQVFAARFGKLQSRVRPVAERGAGAQDNPDIMLVTNLRDADGQPLGSEQTALQFHSDGCFNAFPSLATLLYGIEVPEHGGETLFVSMRQIYYALSPATRKRLLGRTAINYYFVEYEKSGGDVDRPAMDVSPTKSVRQSAHPMVIAHPVSGQPMIFVNRHNTRQIIDMDEVEAHDLLKEVFDAVERREFIYAHKWRRGDLVVWDNRAVQHARGGYPSQERRLLRRFATVCPTRPQPYAE